MSDQNQNIKVVREMIEKAEASLKHAKSALDAIAGGGNVEQLFQEAVNMTATHPTDDDYRVVEGVFDGQNMIGADKKNYPIPANYASKSKLVTGDQLKLTIADDGAFLYKQIGPVERLRVIGKLSYEDGQYIAVTDKKAYKVLLASVTYFKAEIGQNLTLLVPKDRDSDWAAIENVVTNPEGEAAVKEVIAQDQAFDIQTAL